MLLARKPSRTQDRVGLATCFQEMKVPFWAPCFSGGREREREIYIYIYVYGVTFCGRRGKALGFGIWCLGLVRAIQVTQKVSSALLPYLKAAVSAEGTIDWLQNWGSRVKGKGLETTSLKEN